MSVELYNQHAAISELQQTEDEIIDRLNLMYDFNNKFTEELKELCKMTNNVEYDQDGGFSFIDWIGFFWEKFNGFYFHDSSFLQARQRTFPGAFEICATMCGFAGRI
jgi:methionine synthase II (cobalamin-independent)